MPVPLSCLALTSGCWEVIRFVGVCRENEMGRKHPRKSLFKLKCTGEMEKWVLIVRLFYRMLVLCRRINDLD